MKPILTIEETVFEIKITIVVVDNYVPVAWFRGEVDKGKLHTLSLRTYLNGLDEVITGAQALQFLEEYFEGLVNELAMIDHLASMLK